MNFRILGPIEVLGDDGGLLQLGRRMERALLALLVLHADRAVSPDVCIDALWPADAPTRADASLHSLVARLRKRLEPDRPSGEAPTRLVRENAGYRLVASHDEVDSRRFTQAADRGSALLEAGDALSAHRHLAAALAEWRGPALGEFAYDPFADRSAQQMEDLRVGTIEADLGARVALGEPNLVPELDAFVGQHPLREHAWAYLLLALYRAGRQTEALRRAEDLRGTLADVGLEPSPWVRRIGDAILAHDPVLDTDALVLGVDSPKASVTTPVPALPRWWQPSEHFVGRSGELQVLRDAWRRCLVGNVEAVIIAGEPGIGKSALAVESAERAHSMGATVLAGRSSPTSTVAFEPLGEAFGRLVEVMDDAEIAALGDHAPRLSRLLPTSEARLGRRDGVTSHGADVERYLLFEAVSTLVSQWVARAPMVLVVDDLQWADAAGIHLVDHLLRSDRTRSLLIVATVRNEALQPGTRLREFVDSWQRIGNTESVELHGLDLDEIDQLISPDLPLGRGEGAAGAHADLVHSLFETTAGNPFFVVEMARHLSERSGDNGAVPESVQALVRSRLARLDDDRRRVLQLATLQADRIDLGLLTDVYGDEVVVAQAIDAAVSAGLLIERNAMVLFQHDLVRTVLESEIGPAQRTRWHRALGRAYLDRAADDPSAVIDRIANHFVQAASDGDATDAVHYAQLAGDAARAALAYASAAAHYAAGIDAMERANPVVPAAAVELQVSLLEARRLVGDSEQAARECVAFLDSIETDGTLDQLRRFVWVCAHVASFAPPASIDEVDRALARIEARFRDAGDDHRQEAVLVAVGRALLMDAAGRTSVAVTQLTALLEERSSDWNLDLRVFIVDTAINLLGERSPIAERLTLTEELYHTVLDDPSDMLEQRQLTYSAARWAAMTTGAIDRALELDARMAAHADELSMPRYRAGVAQRRAAVDLVRGAFDDAERHSNEAVAHQPDAEFFEGAMAQLAMIRLYQGRVGEFVEVLDTISTSTSSAWQAGLALMMAEVGETSRAVEVLGDYLDHLPEWDRDISWLGSLGLATYATDALSYTAAVGPLLEELEPHVGRVALAGQSALILGPVDLLIGMLHSLGGDRDAAVAHLQAADPILSALDAEALMVRRELAHAEALGAAPSETVGPEALGHARAAVALVARLGIRGSLSERVDRLVH